MERRFLALGFDEVVRFENLGRIAFQDALTEFSAAVEGADTAVVFYSGHGLELGGVNYLIPVDAVIRTQAAARFQAVRLDDVIEIVSGAERLAVVIVDACRNNPFGAKGSKGLVPVVRRPSTVVAYATEPEKLAQDGPPGGLSPYTQALSEALQDNPGLDVRLLFTSLADRTRELAGVPQEPWAAIGNFPQGTVALGRAIEEIASPEEHDAAAAERAIASAAAPAPEPEAVPAVDRNAEAAAAWAGVKESRDVRELEAFLSA